MSVLQENIGVAVRRRREEIPRCDIVLEKCPTREPKDDEVFLEMHSVGICGSDVHFWQKAHIGHFVMGDRLVLGHEASGKVLKCGKNVSHLEPGDRVAIEPGYPLGVDEFFKTGRYNLSDVFFASCPPDDGALQRYYTHKADFCYRLPDNVTYEEGALIEPLSVAIHACRRGKISLGQKVLICGSGPIGLVSLIVAKAMGASMIAVTDFFGERLALAKTLGAHCTVQVGQGEDSKDVAKRVVDAMGGMPDRTVECTGSEAAIRTGIYATKPGGGILLVGLGPDYVNVPMVSAAIREVDIIGVSRYCNTWPTAINMLASGQIDVKPLVTHRFPIEKAQEAFEFTRDSRGIKVIINCN